MLFYRLVWYVYGFYLWEPIRIQCRRPQARCTSPFTFVDSHTLFTCTRYSGCLIKLIYNMIIWKYIILIDSRTKLIKYTQYCYSEYYLLWCEFLMESFHTSFCNFFLQMPENVIQEVKPRMKAATWGKLLLCLDKHLLPPYFWNGRFCPFIVIIPLNMYICLYISCLRQCLSYHIHQNSKLAKIKVFCSA